VLAKIVFLILLIWVPHLIPLNPSGSLLNEKVEIGVNSKVKHITIILNLFPISASQKDYLPAS
jgi:hypothetical protein